MLYFIEFETDIGQKSALSIEAGTTANLEERINALSKKFYKFKLLTVAKAGLIGFKLNESNGYIIND